MMMVRGRRGFLARIAVLGLVMTVAFMFAGDIGAAVPPATPTVDAVSVGSTADSGVTISHTTAGSGRLMLVGVSINNDNMETVSSVTYDGLVAERVGWVDHQGSGGDDSRVEIWSLVAPAVGTHDVVVELSAVLKRHAVVGVVTLTGVDQDDPLGEIVATFGDSASPSLSVPSTEGELVLGVFACERCWSVGVVAPALERWNRSVGRGNTIGAGAVLDGVGPAVSLDLSLERGSHWAMGAVPIRPQVVGDPPVAGDVVVGTGEDLPVGWLPDVSDPNQADELTCSIAVIPANGVVAVDPGCSTSTYTPDEDFHGTDLFEYEVSDGVLTDRGEVSVTVTAVNDTPVAETQAVVVSEEVATTVTLTGSDVDGDCPLGFAVDAGPAQGTLGPITNQQCTGGVGSAEVIYTPNSGYTGSDAFGFTVSDPSTTTSPAALITIDIQAVNDPPVAGDVGVETDEDSSVGWLPVVSDPDPADVLICSVAVTPANGVAIVDPDCSAGTYTPDDNFHGSDEFEYEVSDGVLTDRGVVSVTVTAVNDIPVAAAQAVVVSEGEATTVTLTGSDVDGDCPLGFALVDPAPANGTLDPMTNQECTGGVGSAAVVYTPHSGYIGSDVFGFTVSDAWATSPPALITLDVQSLPPSPSFLDDFDDGDLSEYGTIGGNWSTAAEPGRGLVVRQTLNANTVLYPHSESFAGRYEVRAEIWNEDNDATGVVFRLNPADADNFYSCSATSDDGFQAGLWRHINDMNGVPTTLLAGSSWNYVRSRWYTVTITVDALAGTLRCQWESTQAGVELDVVAVDPDREDSGSVGLWLSSEDNFKGDLLQVSPLGPPDNTPPTVDVTSPTPATDTSDFNLDFTATDDVGVSSCSYELDGIGSGLPGCAGTVLSSVPLGDHQLQVFATDQSGNTGSSSLISFSVTEDVSPPQWDPVPENQSLIEGAILSYPLGAIDNVAIDSYSVDDTVNFSIDPVTGLLESTHALPEGRYPVTIFVTDVNLNQATASIIVAIIRGSVPPTNFTVAFIGDQGRGPDAEAVLQLIQNEGAHMVLHQGDFDYVNNPDRWDQMITDVLGADFPYFASVGNHDESRWYGPDGYQSKLLARLSRVPGATCTGEYGVNSACTFNGLLFILSGVDVLGTNHDTFISDELATTEFLWRICSFHKTMQAMQVGGKGDSTGWAVYEECRRGGAMIATAHEHSYHRTKTLVSMQNQTIDPAWPQPDEVRIGAGSSFVFVSGLGGKSIRDQERCLPTAPPYGCNGEWASIYTSNQGANYGALFCSFNVNGQPDKAHCYFKDIDGYIPDQFHVTNFNASPS